MEDEPGNPFSQLAKEAVVALAISVNNGLGDTKESAQFSDLIQKYKVLSELEQVPPIRQDFIGAVRNLLLNELAKTVLNKMSETKGKLKCSGSLPSSSSSGESPVSSPTEKSLTQRDGHLGRSV